MLSFFRKLSLGGKIKDGILPERIMGTAEDLLTSKSQSTLVLKTDTEMKEYIYGKLRSICVLYRSTFRALFEAMSDERWCDITNDVLYTNRSLSQWSVRSFKIYLKYISAANSNDICTS